jgi:hypothetical protein
MSQGRLKTSTFQASLRRAVERKTGGYVVKFTLKILDGPMLGGKRLHPAHHEVYTLKGTVDVVSLTEGEWHLLVDTEAILERVLGYRFHILQEE